MKIIVHRVLKFLEINADWCQTAYNRDTNRQETYKYILYEQNQPPNKTRLKVKHIFVLLIK